MCIIIVVWPGSYEHVQNQYCGEPANDNHFPSSTWEGFTVDTCRHQCDEMGECSSFSYTNANWEGAPWCVHYTREECVLTSHPNWDHYIKPKGNTKLLLHFLMFH